MKRLTVILLFVVTACAVNVPGATVARAFPAYSQKEKKACLYCHVNPGGGGKRNAAGLWYKNHALSFAGYTPEKANTEADAAKPKTAPAPKVVAKPKVTPKPKTKPTPKPKVTPKPKAKSA
ncbi:MAG: hypothetical protein H7Y38_08610 [Armatimonadetes bacterium]|nr:hypothetical protein [Armatimonadota bacterium]